VSQAARQAATPAGFWHRYAAWSLDWTLLGSVLGLLLAPLMRRAWAQALALNQLLQDWVMQRVIDANGMPSPVAMSGELLSDPTLQAAAGQGSAALSSTITSILLLLFGVSAMYFVVAEAGPWQGTPGKRLLGLRVRRADGGDIGIGRALGRHLAGALSWLLLNLGHAIAGWRGDKRALHDLVAGTRVDAEGPMPRWGRAWLGLQIALLVGALLGSVGWLLWQLYQISQL
jgi:uncharacterized RDD family membrane protein YckC